MPIIISIKLIIVTINTTKQITTCNTVLQENGRLVLSDIKTALIFMYDCTMHIEFFAISKKMSSFDF